MIGNIISDKKIDKRLWANYNDLLEGEVNIIIGLEKAYSVLGFFPSEFRIHNQLYYIPSKDEIDQNQIDEKINYVQDLIISQLREKINLAYWYGQVFDEDEVLVFYNQNENSWILTKEGIIYKSNSKIVLDLDLDFFVSKTILELDEIIAFCYQYNLKSYIDVLEVYPEIGLYKIYQEILKVFDRKKINQAIIDLRMAERILSNCLIPLNEESDFYDENFKNEKFHQMKYEGLNSITGRIYASSDKLNFQTLPRNEKSLIKALGNHFLVEVDFVSFEWAIACQVLGIEEINYDIHNYISDLIWPGQNKRQEAKTILYSIMYGKSYKQVFKEYQFDITQDKNLYNIFISIENFAQELKNQYKKKNYIKNYFGRKIFPKSEFQCFNNYIQSTAADILVQKILLINVWQCQKNFLILQQHDSLLLNVENEEKLQSLKEIFYQKIFINNKELKSFKFKISTGKTWDNMKAL